MRGDGGWWESQKEQIKGDPSSLRLPKYPLKVGFEGSHRTSQAKMKYEKKKQDNSAFGLSGGEYKKMKTE